jgi:hypothetical protein
VSSNAEEISRTRAAWRSTAATAAAVAAVLVAAAVLAPRPLLYVSGALLLAAALLAVGQSRARRATHVPPSGRDIAVAPWALGALSVLVVLAAAFTLVSVIGR